METENFYLEARDGKKIEAGCWIPENEKAIVCFVHGIGEHYRRYSEMAEYLNVQGFAVFAYDQRGHGKTEGKRGHSPSYSLLLDDVENIMKHARSIYPDLPMFLYGHSWGGNIVANFLLKRKTREIVGAILSAPWLELKLSISPLLLSVVKFINNIYPSFTQNNRVVPELLSKNPEEVKAYMQDPLVHARISVATYFQAYRQGKWAIENAHTLNTPTLIIHGTEDEITSFDASKKFAENAATMATFKALNGVKHEPHHDTEKMEVLQYISSWLKQKIPVSEY